MYRNSVNKSPDIIHKHAWHKTCSYTDRQLIALLPSSVRESTVGTTSETLNYKIQCTYVSLTLTISEQTLFVLKPYFKHNTMTSCEDHVCHALHLILTPIHVTRPPYCYYHRSPTTQLHNWFTDYACPNPCAKINVRRIVLPSLNVANELAWRGR
jgi:hypothetical protein